MAMFSLPIETERLKLREFVLEDLDAVFDTLRPETSGGRVFEKKTIADAKSWLHNRMSEHAKLGYSVWAVETKNGEFVGVCGLIPWEPVPMICYAVRNRCQGEGYASEAAKAVIELAAEEFGAVISTIRDTNGASIRVAEKIGMRISDVAFSDNHALKSFVYP